MGAGDPDRTIPLGPGPARRLGDRGRRHHVRRCTPRATPRARCCFLAADLGCVFTGDTLFQGGPGATGRSFSDRPTLEESIRERLFALPDDTVVHTGHGDDTTIGAERADSFDWDD